MSPGLLFAEEVTHDVALVEDSPHKSQGEIANGVVLSVHVKAANEASFAHREGHAMYVATIEERVQFLRGAHWKLNIHILITNTGLLKVICAYMILNPSVDGFPLFSRANIFGGAKHAIPRQM